MKAAVITFPGSNCDRDARVAIERVTGRAPAAVWHADTELPDVDLVVVPGGFSYGDYLRCGAMAAHSPIMREVAARADKGVRVLGICNGFQILTEAKLLPGALLRNGALKFICRIAPLRVETAASPFTAGYAAGTVVRFPVAHHDGNYVVDPDTVKRLEDEDRIAFRYADPDGNVTDAANPNGSTAGIAGVLSARRNVLGLMPHPERAVDPLLGGTDGVRLFDTLCQAVA